MKRTLCAVAAMGKTFAAFITLLALMPACATAKETRQGEPKLGGLATVSALIVGLPLTPCIPINAVRGVHERNIEKRLQAELDQEYSNRIQSIQARDPIADAKQAWSAGTKAFLPSAPGGILFPGIENSELIAEFNSNNKFGSENYARLQESEFLRNLQTLLSEDPAQIQHKDFLYFSQIHNRFVRVCWNYREAFNHEMWRRYVTPELSL